MKPTSGLDLDLARGLKLRGLNFDLIHDEIDMGNVRIDRKVGWEHPVDLISGSLAKPY